MDAKITKERISRLLSYDWLKIVGIIVTVIVLWTLVFNLTATRARPSQKFKVFNYHVNEMFSEEFETSYSNFFRNNGFSYEVIEADKEDLSGYGEANALSLLDGRLSINDGDAVFVPNTAYKVNSLSYEDENGEKVYRFTHLEYYVWRYLQYTTDLDVYFSELETYLNKFYDGDYLTNALNEEKVATEFRARAKANKDKRYRKEEKILAGIEGDKVRIQKYRDALIEFNEYVAEGLVQIQKVQVKDTNGELFYEGNYAINICVDESKTGNLKNYVKYMKTWTEKDENGEEKEKKQSTAQDMCVVLIKSETEKGFEYESLLFVNEMIRLSKTVAVNP